MTKYRIKQIGSDFYPQYRSFFTWDYFYDMNDDAICFRSIEKARKYLDKDSQWKKSRELEKIHPYP